MLQGVDYMKKFFLVLAISTLALACNPQASSKDAGGADAAKDVAGLPDDATATDATDAADTATDAAEDATATDGK